MPYWLAYSNSFTCDPHQIEILLLASAEQRRWERIQIDKIASYSPTVLPLQRTSMTLSPQIQALLPLFCIAFCTLALKQYYLNIRKDNPQGLPPPPGPKPWPIIGNMFDAPHTSPWIAFQKWGLIYGWLLQTIPYVYFLTGDLRAGDIVSFRVFSQTFVVINSREIAFDLLEMRSRNYSDRPDVPLLKMSGWDFNFVTMRYGPKWRAHRRLFNEKFRADAAVSYQPAQLNSAYTLLRGILKNPNDFVECLKTYVLLEIFSMVYDLR